MSPKIMEETDIAWSAGFFEGEGSICLNDAGRWVSANQKDKAPLEKLQRLWGGTIKVFKTRLKGKNHGLWQWSLYSKKALPFLKAILLYIPTPLRREEIEKYIEFYTLEARSKQRRQITDWAKIRIAERNARCEAEIVQYEL